MKVEGYMDLTLEEVKKILAGYAESQGYEANEVFIPEQINSNSTISISIVVKPKINSSRGPISG